MEHVNVPPLLQHIFWNGVELHVEDRTLGEYGLVPDATVYLKTDDASDAAAKQDQEAAFIEGSGTTIWAVVRGMASLTSRASSLNIFGLSESSRTRQAEQGFRGASHT